MFLYIMLMISTESNANIDNDTNPKFYMMYIICKISFILQPSFDDVFDGNGNFLDNHIIYQEMS